MNYAVLNNISPTNSHKLVLKFLRSCLVQLHINTLYTSYSMRNEEQITGMFIN